jgi:hypothetical protein
MHIHTGVLVLVGSFCLIFTLALAWCLVGVRSSAFMKRLFPNYQYLLKAHLDYLFMTGLLMTFFLLFTHFSVSPPAFVLVAMSLGSLGNPAGFLALAVKPDIRQHPVSPFGATMAVSFALTTVGYVGAAWAVSQAALAAR